MSKNLFKRAGLVLFATAFAFIPAAKAGAASVFGAAFEDSDQTSAETTLNSWEGTLEDGATYCPADVQSYLCDGKAVNSEGLPVLSASNSDRYVNITVHSGAHGHFEGEADAYEYTKTYFYVDPLEEYPTIVSDDPSYVFMGWATDENATEPNIEMGSVRAGQVGADIYAIWSTKAYILYHIPGGIWTNPADGEEYQHVLVEYNAGAHFQDLGSAPTPFENYYNFTGWNTKLHRGGEHYDASKVIDEYYVEVYAEWQYDPSRVDSMVLDTAYDVTVGVAAPVFKFTPSETAYYEVYTDGIISGEDEALQGIVRVQDEWDRMLAMEEAKDPAVGWGDVHTFYEMQAGETYYIRFTEGEGHYLHFDAYITKSAMATVTFDANDDHAWFGNDSTQKTRSIQLPIGKDIKTKRLDGDDVDPLTWDDESLVFASWGATPTGGEDEHSYLIVTGDITVYALWLEMPHFHFDFNGGYHPFDKDVHELTVNINPSYPFESPIDPDIDDSHKDFAGWSTDPAATEPERFGEGHETAQTVYNWLNGRTLYAVYTDKVTVTFETVGGAYMMDDPSATVYETALGTGHIFYGMAVMHDNEHVKHEGWVDQNGVAPTATSDVDGQYYITEDTTFTSILKYEMRADANGGYFTAGCGLITGCESQPLRVVFDDDHDKFSYEEALAITETPVSSDASKRFLGFATSPYATEPNIIDGETYLESLYDIYAVWGDVPDDPDDQDDPDDSGDSDSEPSSDSDTQPDSSDSPSAPDSGFATFAKEAGMSGFMFAGAASGLLVSVAFILRRRKA